MRIERYDWPRQDTIAQHYIERQATLLDWIGMNSEVEQDWHERAEWFDLHGERLQASRSALCDVLSDYHRSFPHSLEEQIELLRDERALVVIGGQQAGLFGGPMLVIYKAISIILAAQQASQRLARAVIPMLWIAGEDHDWEEVNHIYTQDMQGKLQQIKIHSESDLRSSVSSRNISQDEWHSVLAVLRASQLTTEYTEQLFTVLHEFAEQSKSLSDFFARILNYLFGSFGLLLIDAADPAIRQLESAMFCEIVKHRHEFQNVISRATATLQSYGYEQAVTLQENQSHFFLEVNGQRTLLFEESTEAGRFFTNRHRTIKLTEHELLDIAAQQPQRLSNNVLSRPLMQQYLLPVIATVIGRAEMAYWSLLPEAFRLFNWQMPLFLLRREYTIIEPPIARALEKIDVSIAEATSHFEQAKAQWLLSQDEAQWPSQFAQLKSQIQSLYEPLLHQLDTLQTGIGQLGRQNLKKVEEQIDFLEKRTLATFAQQHETSLRNWERIHQALYPLGKYQERVYNVITYLNRNGDQWLQELMQQSQGLSDNHHHLIFLSPTKEEVQ